MMSRVFFTFLCISFPLSLTACLKLPAAQKLPLVRLRNVDVMFNWSLHNFQLKFTCSKSTIETLEKGVKYVQS